MSSNKSARKKTTLCFAKTKNDFQEFTNKKELDKQMKFIESSPLFQGKCDQIITETDKECENFIEEASKNKKIGIEKICHKPHCSQI